MKKQVLNLGKALQKKEQLQINGGRKQCKPRWSEVCIDFGRHCSEWECAFVLGIED
ncbi:hypothetical protein [Tenacibaculum litopenaei]|jgi:hypothetical protein|uniref:hypothetical protein n=1 Tax=Tenacibaculum litopenaei TaxID=396016 RepID=UPI0038B4934D